MKTVDFSETIAASDLKVSRSSHLIEYMKVCEYLRSMSFLDLGPRKCTFGNLGFSMGKSEKQWIFQKLLQPVTLNRWI